MRDGSQANDVPKPDLLDPVLLPQLERVVLEAGQEVRHASRHGGVDAHFVNHLAVRVRLLLCLVENYCLLGGAEGMIGRRGDAEGIESVSVYEHAG